MIRQLVEAETSLQEILGVEVDAVLDPTSGTPILLRRAQAEMYLLLRQLPALVWSTDTQLRVTSALGAGVAMMGTAAGQMVGHSLVGEAPPGLRGRQVVDAHLQALQGRSVAFDFDVQGRTLQAHVEPLRGSGGKVDGCLGMALDITDRAQAEAALRQLRDELEARVEEQTAELRLAAADMETAATELRVHNDDLLATRRALETERQRYRDLFEFAPDGYVVTDLFGAIQEANQAAGQLLAGEAGQLAGRSLILFVAGADRPALLEKLAEVQVGRQKQAIRWEGRLEPPGGRGFDAAVTVAPVAAAAGRHADDDEPAELRWLIRDVSERKQAALERERLLAQAQEARRQSEEQAALLDAVLVAIADGLVLYDAEGYITRSNARADELLRYGPSESAVPFQERVERRQPVDDQGRPLKADRAPAGRALRGETVHGEIMGMRPGGLPDDAVLWLSVSAAPVRDSSGQMLGAVATFADISELRQARTDLERRVEERTVELRQSIEALQASEERYRTVSELTSDYIYRLAVDAGDQMEGTLVTAGFQRLTGFDLDEVKDMANWRKFLHADDLARAVEFFASVVSSRRPASTEVRMLTREGEILWTELSARPVWGESEDRVVAIEGAVKDVTERKEAQAALIRAERLGTAGRLAASLAHEINNPLQSAIGCVDLAREALAEGEDPSRYLDVVSAALERATGVVAQLRGLHRETRAEEKHPVRLASVVEQLLVLTRKRCYGAGVEVVCDVSPDLPPLTLQRDSISQVFLNLVLNAVDAMPGGGTLHISSQATAEPEGVWIRFADSGAGLPPEIAEHLFEPFHSTKREGLGLGLFISNNIVQQHGGRVVVESRDGGGTVFSVWLPA